MLGEDGIAQSTNKTFYNLLNKYGWEIAVNSNGGLGPDHWSYETSEFNIRLNPFFLNSTELIYVIGGALRYHGHSGVLWTGTPKKQSDSSGQIGGVYFIGFNSDSRGIGTARSDYNRFNPTPLRCLTQ